MRTPRSPGDPPPIRSRHRPDVRAELRRWYGVETDEQVRVIAERTLDALNDRRAA
jgi:hypothetical protein